MAKKILIIGNGAKEYALAKKLSESHVIYVTPSSDALKEFATCLDIREDSVNELIDFVMENQIDMTIPISQKSIDANIINKFNQHKLVVFGPSLKSAEIAINKILAKKTLYKLRIPTPKFGIFEKQNIASDYLKNQTVPFVIKNNTSNSATIITNMQTGKNIVDYSFIDKNNRLIIEDYIYGTSFSFYTITDGYKALPIGSSIVYKHSLEGDGGQLTQGMASCVPNYRLSIENEYYLMDNVIYPTLDYLESMGAPFLGILGINGILTDDGKIFILGWQSFFNDCDAAGLLSNIDENLYDLFYSCAIGAFSDEYDNVNIKDNSSVSLVLYCRNKSNCENVISGIDMTDDSVIKTYYPGVKQNKYFEMEANNGPVLVLTASSRTVGRAAEYVYNNAELISFNGCVYRKDICKVE